MDMSIHDLNILSTLRQGNLINEIPVYGHFVLVLPKILNSLYSPLKEYLGDRLVVEGEEQGSSNSLSSNDRSLVPSVEISLLGTLFMLGIGGVFIYDLLENW